jgi:hypothetical protein
MAVGSMLLAVQCLQCNQEQQALDLLSTASQYAGGTGR